MNLLPFIVGLITIMFFVSGIDKIVNLRKVATGLENRITLKFPFKLILFAILLAGLLEIVAPSIMMFSSITQKFPLVASLASVSLALFTILATLVYHFPPFGAKYYPFMSNITTTGALLLLAMVFRNNCSISW